MSPLVLVVAFGVVLAAAMGVAVWLGGSGDAQLERRLRKAAAVLGGDGAAPADVEVAVSVFRHRAAKSQLNQWLDHRFSMLEGRSALPRAIAGGFLVALGIGAAALLLRFGPLLVLIMPLAWVAGTWGVLKIWDMKVRGRFVKQFPEIVDHVVRLTRAGLPPVEAVSVVAQEAAYPARGVLQQVADECKSGLDPELVLRGMAEHLRIPEFTLFSAALCLQRTTGGAISAAMGNLSGTLRARLEVAMKANASTAQTRITLWVLSAVPVVVLFAQSYTNPEAMDMLFQTESGAVLLRWGVGLIVSGLLVAYGIASRVGR